MNHRFYVPDGIEIGATVPLPESERHHARVLRVREGEEVELFDSQGRNFLGRFAENAIAVVSQAANRELRTAIDLAMAIIQLEKFELILQKATELGVRSIVPLITARTEVRPERYRGKEDRWRKIVFEATKQSGRSIIPAIDPSTSFEDLLGRPGAKIIFDADAEPSTTRQSENPTTLLIGPEGGWSEEELRAAREHGCLFERLGPRRLRAETAAIVATAIVAARIAPSS